MSLIGGLLKAAASFCHSTLIQSPRSFSTGTRKKRDNNYNSAYITCGVNCIDGVCSRIRMHVIPQPRIIDRWTEKRVAFGVYDNIGILGDFKAHPRDLIVGPVWLRGFRGNEFQRLTRKKRMVGDRMMATDRHNLEKRIRFLYRRLNRYGKHR